MQERRLGRSDIEVSPMGLGCWAIGGPWTWEDGEPMGWGRVDDRESIRAIHRAIDLGITFFDTAANYGCGHSERILGQAIADRRDRVVIATKFGHVIDEQKRVAGRNDAVLLENIRQDCDASLRRLGTDVIDLYQLHEADYDPQDAVAVRDVLEALVQEGKIRAYGWSTDDPARAQVFAEGEHCAAIQHILNVLMDGSQMLALCSGCDLASINRTPLLMGLLTGKFTPDSTFSSDDVRHDWDLKGERGRMRLQQLGAVRDILTSNGRTLAQGALAWVWARSERTIPIPGFRTAAQVEENARAMEFGPLSGAQMLEIQSLLGRV